MRRGISLGTLAGALTILLSACGGHNAAPAAAPAGTIVAAGSGTVAPLRTAAAGSVALPTAAAGQPAANGTAASGSVALPTAAVAVDRGWDLARALMLGVPDLPPGFQRSGDFIEKATEPGELSSTGILFLQSAGTNGSDGAQLVVDDLDIFSDAQHAEKAFNSVVAESTPAIGYTLYPSPLDGEQTPSIGDQILARRVGARQGDVILNGYVFVFRQGKYIATMIQLARPEPAGTDQIVAISHQQDAKLLAAQQ